MHIEGQALPIPYAFVKDYVLESCFPGKDKKKLREFLTLLRWRVADKQVAAGILSYNFMFDSVGIAALQSFQRRKKETSAVADLGCGNGIMTLLYLIAGAKEVHAFDLASPETLWLWLKVAIAFNFLYAVEIEPGIVLTQADAVDLSRVQKLRFKQCDITAADFSLESEKFSQIWAARFLHTLSNGAIEKLKPKIWDALEYEGSLYAVVNAVQFLWTSHKMFSGNRFSVERLISRIDESNESIVTIFGCYSEINWRENSYHKIQDANIEGRGRALSSVFTCSGLERLMKAFHLFDVSIKGLTIFQEFTSKEEEFFHLYATGRKASKAEAELDASALSIEMD